MLWLRIDARLRPSAEKACLHACRNMTSQIVAESVAAALEIAASMDLSLTYASHDVNGNITGIHAGSDAINTVQTVLLEEINAALAQQRNAEFTIRLGTLTGMYTLTGRGAEIPLRYVPAGSAEVKLQSDFSSAGINQTIHTLTAEITIHAGCSVPLYRADTTQTFTYLLAETVIVGDVPAVSWGERIYPAA